MKTTKFVRKPLYVEAVRVTAENMDEVAEWCGGYVDRTAKPFIKVDVKRALHAKQTQAYSGDWVLQSSTGFKVYIHKALFENFDMVATAAELAYESPNVEASVVEPKNVVISDEAVIVLSEN